MGKVLYFDCFSGISGDMCVGALLDLGIDENAFRAELKKLNLEGYEIEIKKTVKNSITGTDFDVILTENIHNHQSSHDYIHSQNHFHQHHKHNHEHHTHSHEISEHNHKHGTHSIDERKLVDIKNIIKNSGISEKSKKLALEIFLEIGKAEAEVHGKSIDEIHFHEVSAVDSIVDIVSVAICLDLLGISEIYCSSVHEGSGFVHCSHGKLPVPVPAVLKMLEGSNLKLVIEDINHELITPTGIGILKSISKISDKKPEIKIEKVGYGFGKKDTGSLNALRIYFGEIVKGLVDEEVVLLETNIDDISSEIMGYVFERIMENGGLDAYFTPIFMKKQRPAYMFSVISKQEDAEKISDIIFKETNTLGVRIKPVKRISLNRKIETIQTEFGEVRLKKSFFNGEEKTKPEYEDCRKIAKENNLSLYEVYEIIKRCQNGK